MLIPPVCYRAFSRLAHWLSAWNTGGEGIHSPYLFYLVRMLMYDTNHYYVWQQIEERRLAMLRAHKLLHVRDFGTGVDREERVSHIASTALEDKKVAQLLFRLVLFLGEEGKKNGGLNILELGSSLGITTAYLAAADSRNNVLTMEGSTEIASMARLNWEKLQLDNISCLEGNIDALLPSFVQGVARGQNLIYIDANHTREATVRYFLQLLPLVDEKSIMVFDDIHHSQQMNLAWTEIKNHPSVTTTMDLWHCGLVFFDTHYLKKHYRLRL